MLFKLKTVALKKVLIERLKLKRDTLSVLALNGFIFVNGKSEKDLDARVRLGDNVSIKLPSETIQE
jgi:hypothetical protein